MARLCLGANAIPGSEAEDDAVRRPAGHVANDSDNHCRDGISGKNHRPRPARHRAFPSGWPAQGGRIRAGLQGGLPGRIRSLEKSRARGLAALHRDLPPGPLRHQAKGNSSAWALSLLLADDNADKVDMRTPSRRIFFSKGTRLRQSRAAFRMVRGSAVFLGNVMSRVTV